MQIPKKKRAERLKQKQCVYPGCNNEFFGIGKSKYCLEHRKVKYQKIIKQGEKIIHKSEIGSNQIIDHSYNNSQLLNLKCELEGCNKEFKIVLIPNTKVYPKYCPEHRNEYKRNLYLQRKKNEIN
jgi:hypothetical protein